MIRHLGPTDVARALLSGSLSRENRAYTLDRVDKRMPMVFTLLDAARIAVSLRGSRCSWVSTHENRTDAFAAARPRSAPQSWEVTHLLLGRDGERGLPGLLEKVAESATQKGAQRIFIRLRDGDPMSEACRLAGFFHCFSETLYRGEALDDHEYASPALRERLPEDDHALFRLYNAATPSDVRCVYGMTLDQWRSSQETLLARSQEFVYERNGSVRGWLKAQRRFRSGHVAIAVHPDEQAGIPFLLRFALAGMREGKEVFCVVPEYQTAVRSALQQQGFEPVSEYVMMARSMTVGVEKEAERATATVASA